MIERVAKAIDESLSRELADDKPHFIDTIKIARAAIESMREPTEEMLNDGCKELWNIMGKQEDFRGDARAVWQAMIDEILRD